jgi:hypothetical protein
LPSSSIKMGADVQVLGLEAILSMNPYPLFWAFRQESFFILLCGRKMKQVAEAAFDHLALEGRVVGVADGLHAGFDCGGDVFFSVVDEENVGGRGFKALGGVAVDFELGLGNLEQVGPGAVVEVGDPGRAGAGAPTRPWED